VASLDVRLRRLPWDSLVMAFRLSVLTGFSAEERKLFAPFLASTVREDLLQALVEPKEEEGELDEGGGEEKEEEEEEEVDQIEEKEEVADPMADCLNLLLSHEDALSWKINEVEEHYMDNFLCWTWGQK